ncbi:exodeoxyribonuclease VII large subunit [Thermoflavifilum thermophilum]|uniref:Exodeoxyribonuclease 7 large subunit n=1 Tax=Thermoflavifilum thermophilum TaxID=1393122 RepID=A0A1I7N2K6_9BACT|nr:exodeoxyribonuclease VII large subunit [Thermoflavifilum thermophilum]SFV28901.1 Exodeoxyribonuclease VII large subunit [Thermoflavifilum thermophilum]
MSLQPKQPYLSLYELSLWIKNTIQQAFPERIWIKAEIHKLNYYPHSGHCYPDLVEKREDKIVAEMRGLLWSSHYRRINAAFQRLTGEPLRDGLKVLCLVEITFDTRRGIALMIHDIDPSFTLGDLEKEKQQTIQRLKQEGYFDCNRQLPIPLLPKRIAVISALTSRGYADFMNVLQQRSDQYKIICKLFPAWLQGDKAVASIIAQLNHIRRYKDVFDVVAIIRGGGGETGLAAFNDYLLAKEVATFPLPVLTGIGHATNQTVTEMVACVNCITPTKLAEFLIERFDAFADTLHKAEDSLIRSTRMQMHAHKEQLLLTGRQLEVHVSHDLMQHRQQIVYEQKSLNKGCIRVLQEHQTEIRMLARMIGKESRHLLQQNRHVILQWVTAFEKNIRQLISQFHQQMNIREKQIHWYDPIHTMKRGFTITLHNGKMVSSVTQLRPDDRITTRFADGEVDSHIERIRDNEFHDH